MRLIVSTVAAAGLVLARQPAIAQQPAVPGGIHLLPPSALPLPAPATTEVLGYPAVSADRTFVSAMLREGRFEELERYLTGLQNALRGRIQREYDLLEATRAFATADSVVGSSIARWVAGRPGSARARSAQATWGLAETWRLRGKGSASSVSSAARAEMSTRLNQALADGREALRLDSADYTAYVELLDGLTLTGDLAEARTVFNASRRAYPGSHYLAHLYLKRLRPRWGGSYEAMNAFAAEIAGDSVINPRLRTFLGAVEHDLAEGAVSADSIMSALRHANASLRYGPEFYYLIERGHANAHFGDFPRAIADLNAALSQRPRYVPALELHAEAVLFSASWARDAIREAALREVITEYELVLSLEPTNTWARDGLRSAQFELKNCPEFKPECGGGENGLAYVVTKTWKDLARWLGIIGVGAFISWWAFIRWARAGFYLPAYVHVIALLALIMIGMLQYQWTQTGAPMTARRWVVTFAVPVLVYVLFIGLGGAHQAQAARRKAGAPRGKSGPD